MFLFLSLIAVIAFLVFYYLRSELKPLRGTFEHKGATENSSPVYRTEGTKEEFPVSLKNDLYPEKPIETLYELGVYAAEKYADRRCLGSRSVITIHEETVIVDERERVFTYPELGPYEWKTYKEVFEEVRHVASGLRDIGMNPGDYLAIFEDTCHEWTVASRASFSQSMAIFTVYANLGVDALVYALNEGEIQYILANSSLVPTLIEIKEEVPTLHFVISNGHPSDEMIQKAEEAGLIIITFDELIERGKKNPVEPVPPKADDISLIMYTSGSTGVPKGVMTTHKNIISACAGACDCIEFLPDDKMLHYLPLAHSMANMIESLAVYCGVSMGYGSPRTLTPRGVRKCNGDLKEFEPTLFVGVPTVFEKIKHAVWENVQEKGALTKFLFTLGLKHKLKALKTGSSGAIWDKLLFNKIRVMFGVQNFRYMVTGSAPLSGEIQDFCRALFGCPMLQGYGLTETCSASVVQDIQDFSNFTAGVPTGTTEVKLVDVPDMNYFHTDNPCPRGEIWMRGPTISMGYYKNKEKTDEAFSSDPDGDSPYKWFATGDIGRYNEQGHIQIIDRKKNLIKASHGEYIALEKLESAYRNCSLLDTLIVYVDGLHFHCVIVGVPNRERITSWAASKGIDTSDYGAVCSHHDVRHHVLRDLARIAKERKFRSIETIKAVYLSPEEWTPQNNLLTAAMKLNRSYIIETFRGEIDAMYTALGE
eukprot:TRINITY_DN381_c0_g1_i1.p1 TRINITY_DN381_c0_g1~~TRINITY_DN381_c0_g1_i1.p1  ORF type:complete len:706 (+),score=169.78 TRINITY_DN381_c0_g1_i1:25-2142(+)